MSKPLIKSKVLHLQLTDIGGGDYTLLTNLVDGSIKHILYNGHSSYGTKFSLAKLGLPNGMYLPVEPTYEDETIEEFRNRIIQMIEEESQMIIVRVVQTEVKFHNYE